MEEKKLKVIDIKTKETTSEVKVPEKILKYLNYKNAKYVLHEYVVAYLANKRQGTHNTKTRSEVVGGGKKPWVQKHTGRARQGSIRSPLWRKGGIVFGPKPRDYNIDLPQKKKTLAKYLSLAEKLKEDKIVVVKELKINSNKTKEALEILKTEYCNSKKILLIDKNFDDNIKLATRNLEKVDIIRVNDLNAYSLLNSDKIIITEEAWLCL